jgi:inosose dehydratase
MTINFGIAPINWTNDDDPNLGGEISLQSCLSDMRNAGFKGCELGNKFPKDLGELKKVVENFDLQVTSDWIGLKFSEAGCYEDSINHFKNRLEFLRPLGVKALKVCECGHSIQNSSLAVFNNEVNFTNQQWESLLSGLDEIGRLAAENGMYISYHQHLGTGVASREQLDYLMAKSDPALVTLLPDTGHLFVCGMEPLEIFEKYYRRIKYIHLKDVRRDIFIKSKREQLCFMDAVRAGLFTVPSDGCIDFKDIFKLLLESDFSGWLVVEAEQDPAKANPYNYALKARKFLRQQFGC